MSFALVQHAHLSNPSGTVSSIAATFGSSVTAGNLLVAVFGLRGGNFPTVTDSVNSVNFSQGIYYSPGNVAGIYYYIPPTGGTMTITAAFSIACSPSLDIFEFSLTSGLVVAVDTTASATGTGTTASAGAMTLTASDLVIAAHSENQVTTSSSGSGFTLDVDLAYSSGNSQGLGVEYSLNQSSPVTPTFTLGTSSTWTIAAVAFKAVAPTVLIDLVPYISKDGLFIIGVTNPAGTAVSNVTAVPKQPAVSVNGSPATLYPSSGAVWHDNQHDLPFAAWQITSPSSIAPTDVVTYSYAANGITTGLGSNLAVLAGSPVSNYVGQNEPGFGGVASFTPNRTMPLGTNLGGAAWNIYGPYSVAKNLRLKMVFAADSGSSVTFSSTDPTLPLTFTAAGKMYATVADYFQSNGIEISSGQVGYPVAQGQYGCTFTDANAGGAGALKVFLVGDANICLTPGTAGCVDSAATLAALTPTGQRTVNGNQVTVVWPNVLYSATPNLSHGYNMNLVMHVSSTSGHFYGDGAGGTGPISNFWVFGPGDEDMVTTNPHAMPNWLKGALTAPNGNGPAIIRALETIAPAGYGNYQDYADCMQPTRFSYGAVAGRSITLSAVRFYNTNPALGTGGNSTYGWAAQTRVYTKILGSDGTDMTLGPYLDFTVRNSTQNGETDYGNFMALPTGTTSMYAALEFVTTAAHGLRTGDLVTFPGGSATLAYLIPITGGATTSLPACNVTNGSSTITFASSVTLTPKSPGGSGLVFGSDTTGQAYGVTAGTTGAVFTITPAYHGTTNSASTCNLTAYASLSNITPIVYVTGATTFAIADGFTFWVTSGSTVQTLATTSANTTASVSLTAVAQTISVQSTASAVGPYGHYANIASQWPNTKMLTPLMPYMTDACLQSIADELAANARVNQEFLFELGDEHWNYPSFPVGTACIQFSGLLKYYPPNTVVNNYYTSPATYATPVGIDGAYMLLLGHAVYTIQQQLNTHNMGLKASLAMGAQWTDDVFMKNMVAFANANSIPVDYGMVAPYHGELTSSNVTWYHACATAGTNPGSWSVPLMISFEKHAWKYNSTFWGYYSTNYNWLQGYTGPASHGQTNGFPTMIGYEGGVQDVGGNGISVMHDIDNHPRFYDLWNTAIQCIQDGSWLVPGSGLAFLNLYTFGIQWGNAVNLGQLWSIYIYANQPAGLGLSNIGTTDQFRGVSGSGNRLCNDMTFTSNFQTGSQSIAGQGMLDWFAAANTYSPADSTAAARRWFPGLNRMLRV